VAITSRSLLELKARSLSKIRAWDRFHAAILPGYESPALHCPHNRVREFLAQVSVSKLLTTSTSIPRSVHAGRRALLCIHIRAPIAAIVELPSFAISRTLILKMDFYHDEQHEKGSPKPGATSETFFPLLLLLPTCTFARVLPSES
jgi:hypothetical protein